MESWLEHLRQHERVTNADRELQEHVQRFLEDTPKVSHLIAGRPEDETHKSQPVVPHSDTGDSG